MIISYNTIVDRRDHVQYLAQHVNTIPLRKSVKYNHFWRSGERRLTIIYHNLLYGYFCANRRIKSALEIFELIKIDILSEAKTNIFTANMTQYMLLY